MKPEPQVVREHNRTRRSRTKTDGECRLQGKAAQERLKGGGASEQMPSRLDLTLRVLGS